MQAAARRWLVPVAVLTPHPVTGLLKHRRNSAVCQHRLCSRWGIAWLTTTLVSVAWKILGAELVQTLVHTPA